MKKSFSGAPNFVSFKRLNKLYSQFYKHKYYFGCVGERIFYHGKGVDQNRPMKTFGTLSFIEVKKYILQLSLLSILSCKMDTIYGAIWYIYQSWLNQPLKNNRTKYNDKKNFTRIDINVMLSGSYFFQRKTKIIDHDLLLEINE